MPLLDPAILERQASARAPRDLSDGQRAVLKRAELLDPDDRLLVRLAVHNGVSRRQLAQMFHQQPGSVTRRLQRLGARLNDPLVVALLDARCPLPPEYRQLGVEHFLQGRTMRELADAHQMTLSEVRRVIAYLRGWHRGVSGAK
jgi:DNA-directed RNA polymerase specialized sigma24 family protein